MQTFNKKIAAVLTVAAFAVPMIAFAETSASTTMSADMQVKVQALLAQIKLLQEQIKTIIGTSSGGGMGWNMGGMGSSSGMGMPPGQMGKMACITLSRNLRQGDQGDDVMKLQQMLKEDSSTGFSGNATGFFGPLTMKAMMKFQMNNGISSSTDGSVGPLTRGFFERRCGKGLDGMQGDRMGGGMGKMPGGDMMGGMATHGTISAVGASSITVQTGSTSAVVVNITASTTIKVFAGTSTPPTTGTIANLIVGKTVMVMGTKNSDGSIQAKDIAVGDMLPMMKMDMPGMDDHGGPKGPMNFMPTLNGPQNGPGTNGGPQNW